MKNLNIENDNYRSPIDHSFDYELGVVQTKGAIFDIERNRWMFYVGNEKNKEFEHLIAYCIDVFMKNILRVYIFPKKEVVKRTGISVSIGIYRGRWVDKYRINEKSYNDAFHDIIKYNNAPYKYKII